MVGPVLRDPPRPALSGGLVALLLASTPVLAEASPSTRLGELQERAREDLRLRRTRWAPLEKQQVAVRERFEVLSLLPREIYEKAFQMLEDLAFARRVAEADARRLRPPASVAGDEPGAGEAEAGVPPDLPPGFTVLLQQEKPELWGTIRAQLLARIRGQVKKQALHTGVPYEGVPLLGMHPYQVHMLTGPVAESDDLALPGVIDRLAGVFSSPPLQEPVEDLQRCFRQRSRMDMVAGYARYRLARAEPGRDGEVLDAALGALAELALEGDRPRSRPDPSRILLASLHDMLDTIRRQGSDEVAATVLYAVHVDFQLAVLGLQNRIRGGSSGVAQQEGLSGTPAERVRAALCLDDLLGGRTLLPPRPNRPRPAPGSPFDSLESGDHLRRLERYYHRRLVPARQGWDQIQEKLQLHELAAPGQRPRLVSDIERLSFGRDPQDPAPESLMGRIGSPEFEAVRRYLLWLGPPATPGGRVSFRRVFGEPHATPPDPGEATRLRRQLEETVRPFLRARRVERGELPPRLPGLLEERYQELDRLAGRIRAIDRQLASTVLGERSREPLREEREDLMQRYEREVDALRSPDPLSRMEDYRAVKRWLAEKRGPDGEPLSPAHREVLAREQVRIEREIYPAPTEARRREEELHRAWQEGADLRGRLAPPAVLDALRREIERMRTAGRGADPGPPPGARPGDPALTGRPPPGQVGVPVLPVSPPPSVASPPERDGGRPGLAPPSPGAGGEPYPGVPGSREVTTAAVDAAVAVRRARWRAANGSNPWGFPPYATADEIRTLLDEAIRKRLGPGSQVGLIEEDCERGAGESVDGSTGSREDCSDEGKYRFWLEVRDPGLRHEILEKLERFHETMNASFRAEVEAELRGEADAASAAPGDVSTPDPTGR